MTMRRKVLAYLVSLGTGALVLCVTGIPRFLAMAADKVRRILPKGTDPGRLEREDPALLDTRNLEIMPLEDFETMGDTSVAIDPRTWRLEVSGTAVQTPLTLTLGQLMEQPAVEKEVLLICPGFFSNHGRWKGVRLSHLLQMAAKGALPAKVHIIGSSESGERRETFSLDEIQKEGMLLAYHINGRPLPPQHGFPLRLVAQGHMGFTWVKYVKRVEFET